TEAGSNQQTGSSQNNKSGGGGQQGAVQSSSGVIVGPTVMITDLIPQWHRGSILNASCSFRRSLAVTAASDRSIRGITFPSVQQERQLKIEFATTFPLDDITCIDVHPSGHYALVGQHQKLALYNILLEGFVQQPGREYSSLRGCREACFSHGGNLFVASVSQVIQVYETWTGANRGILSGGTANGHTSRVKQMAWSRDDTRLISTGADGIAVLWDMTAFTAIRSTPLGVNNEGIVSSSSNQASIPNSASGTQPPNSANPTLQGSSNQSVNQGGLSS
ncbi:MAG: putative cilia- and flagella-associated protein 57, partial [Streblomastix strix]